MIKCKYCQKSCNLKKEDKFCSNRCRQMFEKLTSKPYKEFASYTHASTYFEVDHRTLKKWEGTLYKIDKSLQIDYWSKHVICKTCGKESKSSKCRMGYCRDCTKKGLGHKEGGKKLSKIYKGKGNPNYIHGNTKQSILDRKNQWHCWGRFVFAKDNYTCALSGRTDDLQTHHIIPFSLYPNFRFEIKNGIILNRFYHIELHRRQLDLLLLPTLASYKSDVQELTEWFVLQPQVQSLLQLPYQKHDRHELIRVVGCYSNYRKQIQILHPGFDLSFLDHLELK